MYPTIKKDKDELRLVWRERRDAIAKGEKARRDEAICRAAKSLASFRFAKYVLMYAPTDEEILKSVRLEAFNMYKRAFEGDLDAMKICLEFCEEETDYWAQRCGFDD